MSLLECRALLNTQFTNINEPLSYLPNTEGIMPNFFNIVLAKVQKEPDKIFWT